MKIILSMLICFFILSTPVFSELTEEDLKQIQEIVDKSSKELKDEIIGWFKWGIAVMIIVPSVLLTLYGALLIFVLERQAKGIDEEVNQVAKRITKIVRLFRTDARESVDIIKRDLEAFAENLKKELEDKT